MENVSVRNLEQRDHCCLCGKTKQQVPKLIVGLQGAVCSDCIDLCCDILASPGRAADVADVDWDGNMVVAPALRRIYPNEVAANRGLRAYALMNKRLGEDDQETADFD